MLTGRFNHQLASKRELAQYYETVARLSRDAASVEAALR